MQRQLVTILERNPRTMGRKSISLKDCLDQDAKKKQPIQNNSYFCIRNKPVYNNNWIKNGILNIEELMKTQDNLVKV